VSQTPELQLARRVVSARLHRLPAHITPQHITRCNASACDMCGDEVEYNNNWLLECDRCRSAGDSTLPLP